MAKSNMRLFDPHRKQFLQLLLLTCLGLSAASGCTSKNSSPTRFRVSGTVQFNGSPVPVGTIRFIPDVAKGNSGPVGYASISNGQFDTAIKGKGSVGGHLTLIVSGFDGNADINADMPYGRPLFPEYQTEVELPMKRATLNVDVPIDVPSSPPGQPATQSE